MEITTENNSSRTSEQVKPGYKKTAVGIIPEDWRVKSLGKLTIKVGSGSTPRGGSEVYIKDAIPFIRSQNVINNKLDVSDNVCIDEETHKKMKSTYVYSGDVLLNISGASIGRTCVVPEYIKTANVNQHVCIIRLKEQLNNTFLQSYLSSFPGQKSILRNQTGGNREGLNHKSVRSLKLPIPPLPEQKAIADCLTTWDKGIEKLTQLIASKKEQKKGLMQQLLTGKKRLDGFEEEWKEVKLGDVIKVQGGYAFKSNKFKKEGIPIVRISNLDAASGLVSLNNIVYYDEISEKQFQIKNGDIMIAMSGATTGKTAVYTFNQLAYLNQRVGLFKNKDENKFHYSLLYSLVKTNHFENEIKKLLSTGAQPNISNSEIESINIKIPSYKEQVSIAKVLTTADKEIELLEKKLETFKTQKKGLMQVLLTGALRLCSGTNG